MLHIVTQSKHDNSWTFDFLLAYRLILEVTIVIERKLSAYVHMREYA